MCLDENFYIYIYIYIYGEREREREIERERESSTPCFICPLLFYIQYPKSLYIHSF